MNRRVFVVLALAALALPSVGCTDLKEQLTPPPTVVTEEATRAVSGAQVVGELAGGTPADLPLWPEATVVESTTTEDAYTLTLTTSDTFDDVLYGVSSGLEESGWAVAQDNVEEEGAQIAVLEISREDQEGFVTLTEIEEGLTQIDYVIASGTQ